MQKIFSILLLVILLSCQNTVKQKASASHDATVHQMTKNDTFPRAKVLSEEERKLRRKEYEEQELIDSIRLLKVFNAALKYAKHNKDNKSFQYDFEMVPDDSSFNVTTKMVFGNLFCK